MIYDTLNNLPNYLGVSDNLDTVIEYIMARDITTLPAGRTRIDGEKAVVTVSTVTPQSSDKALFQRHDAHIVLETDLEGSELFEVSLAELAPTKPTDEAADTTVGIAPGAQFVQQAGDHPVADHDTAQSAGGGKSRFLHFGSSVHRRAGRRDFKRPCRPHDALPQSSLLLL